jgi:hypothetical protein
MQLYSFLVSQLHLADLSHACLLPLSTPPSHLSLVMDALTVKLKTDLQKWFPYIFSYTLVHQGYIATCDLPPYTRVPFNGLQINNIFVIKDLFKLELDFLILAFILSVLSKARMVDIKYIYLYSFIRIEQGAGTIVL